MVVEQEYADLYLPTDEDYIEYLPGIDCGNCGYQSCSEYANALSKKIAERSCTECEVHTSELLLTISKFNVDPIPFNVMMEQSKCELIPLNNPTSNAPLIVTCNFLETVRLLSDIIITTNTTVYLLPTFTHGYSVDNAVHEKMFKAVEIWKAIQENNVESKVNHRTMIIPGLAEKEKTTIKQITRWNVEVGPVSGFLIPLFLQVIDLR